MEVLSSEVGLGEFVSTRVVYLARSCIWYSRPYRSYGILNYNSDWNDISARGIIYCPFCGDKLSKEFDDEDIEEILRKGIWLDR